MPHAYSDSKYIYSVDMMIAYLNLYKPKQNLVRLNVKDLIDQLKFKGWMQDTSNFISPIDVLNHPKKYIDEHNKILQSDIKYPIIIDINNNVIDGIHRLAKSHLLNKKHINAYVFNNKLLKQFVLGGKADYKSVLKLTIYDYIQMFNKRFKKNK